MAKLLVYEKDNVHIDADKEYRGCYKKGYIVEVFEDSKPHVDPPQPPFLILQVTDRTKSQVDSYMESWIRSVDYNIINRDVALDGWRLDLFTTNPNPSGKGHVPLAKVQTYLENWGAINIGVVSNAVRFDIAISTILQSENFWGTDKVNLIVFNETSYNETNGVHITEANYGALPVPPQTTLQQFEENLESRVFEAGGDVISNTGGVITFDIGRDVVIDKVKEEVKRLATDTICRRQVYLDPSYADAIISAGRFLQATAAEVAPYIKDRMTE